MEVIDINSYVDDTMSKWIESQVTSGRSFPDKRDGLKTSTRAILEVTESLSKGGSERVKMTSVLAGVAKIKDGSDENHQKVLYRMSVSEYPLIQTVNSESNSFAYTIDMMTGFESKARYMDVNLTPLGRYLFKYKNYFKNSYSQVNSSTPIIDYIRTPLPITLLIPHINLADGISNSAPNLALSEAVDAMIVHLEKDKQTTTQDLADHITGFGISNDNMYLYSNQSIHDLIELGIAKGTELVKLDFFKNEYLVRELPYKTFGKSIHKDLIKKDAMGKKGNPRGFLTHVLESCVLEGSKEALIAASFKLYAGSTLEDMKAELYKKSDLRKTIVYRNIVNDFDNADKNNGGVLTVMSVRDVLDYYYHEGIELKTLEIKEDIKNLEAKFGDALFLEKVTKPIVASIISDVTTMTNKRYLGQLYLNGARDIFKNYINGEVDLRKEHTHIRQTVEDWTQRLKEQHASLPEDDTRTLFDLIDEELPEKWEEYEVRKVFTEQFLVLYKLDKRDEAIEVIRGFQEQIATAKARLDFENIKQELIAELREVKKRFGKTAPNNYIARPYQERETMKEFKKNALKEMKRIPADLPVNVLISHDGYVKLSFSVHDTLPNLWKVYQATILDKLVVVNREGNSHNFQLSTLSSEPTKLFDKDYAVLVTVRSGDFLLGNKMVLVTNRGRVTCINDNALKFTTKQVKTSLTENETFVYARYIDESDIEEGKVVVMKEEDSSYKGIFLADLAVKNSLAEMYSMYAGGYTTSSINTVAILPHNTFQFRLWTDRGWNEKDINKLRCRNVSNPIVPKESLEGYFVQGKTFSWNNDTPVYDLNTELGDTDFETIQPAFLGDDIREIDEKITFSSLSDFNLIEVDMTPTRKVAQLFTPNEVQYNIILGQYDRGGSQ